jgi:AAA ATPase domain
MADRRQPGFQGRTSECQVLDGLLEDVRGGGSAALVIRGEAGVGKTALLRYATGKATGFRIVQLSGVEAEMELPFAGLQQLCAPMVDQLPVLPGPQQDALRVAFGLSFGDAPDPFLVGLGTLSLLSEAAAGQPLVCLVDDAQWLDGASRQVLGFVARRLLAESVGIVFGVREAMDEREPRDERELVRLPELLLTGLNEEDAGALLAAVVPGRLDQLVRDRIIEETRGNPLALLELSRGITAAKLAGGFALPAAVDLPAKIEDHYLGRVRVLPEPTQHLMLLAAADPVGDAALLWRAAQSLGIEPGAAEPAEADQLLEIGAGVRFRHPLVRSAVYRAASPEDRRAAHGALARATDPEADPDRRAWHRAHSVSGPDEEVAGELLRRANDAERRGGIAAAAAFMEWAAMLTPDLGARASRALAAAGAKFEAGDFAAAESLLATADAGPLDELGRAQVERMRAQIVFDLRRGSDAPALLLHAAQRLEDLDAELARETYLEWLVAVIYAAGLVNDTKAADLAMATRSAPFRPPPRPARQQLLLGLGEGLVSFRLRVEPACARLARCAT